MTKNISENGTREGLVFVTAVGDKDGKQGAQMLLDSLRTFGGSYSGSPLWIFDISPGGNLCGRLASGRVECFPLSLQPPLAGYPFAGKVAACARAERMASADVSSLVWVSADCLIFNSPQAYDLSPPHRAALRPVHSQNIGAPSRDPLPDYWREIYAGLEGGFPAFSVTSFVDQVSLHPYFNTHAFAVDPRGGWMERWLEVFQNLVMDDAFQRGLCQSRRRKIFLHQAVFSAILAVHLGEDRIRILPPEYSYPYNLQDQVPPEQKIDSCSQLVSLTWEGRTLDPEKMGDIDIGERYRNWLGKYSR